MRAPPVTGSLTHTRSLTSLLAHSIRFNDIVFIVLFVYLFRETTTLALRKEKKEEGLAKRRNLMVYLQ